MATSLEWARPLDERSRRYATDYAVRTAEYALVRGEASIALRIGRQLAFAAPGDPAHVDLITRAMAARDAASDAIARGTGSADPDILNAVAAAHLTLGEAATAANLWLTLARSDPTRLDAFVSFAWCMARVGNWDSASQIIRHVSGLASHPKIDAVGMMIALAAGDHDAALALAQAALASDPEAHAWLPLGAVFKITGAVNAAAVSLGLRLEDLSASQHLYDVGQAIQSGRHDEAIRAADEVLAAIPDDRWAWMFKIIALVAKEDKVGAVRAQAALASVMGASLDTLTRLIDLLFEISAHQLVVDLGTTVRERLPHHYSLLSTIAHSASHVAEMDLVDEVIASLQPLGETIGKTGLSPFIVMSMSDDPLVQRAAAERRARILPAPEAPPAAPVPALPAGARLKIGYFSNDFHNHATMKLLTEVLEATDRARFEITAYSYDSVPDDAERERVRRAFDRFENVAPLSEGDIAERIRQDGIHVLVDLKGYTGGSRLGLLKFRPAPIQVNWLGYPGTYGMAEADYVIADRFIIPPDAEGGFSEAVVRLPDCYQPNRRSRDVVAMPTRTMVGLPEDAFVFASFNHVYKVGSALFAAWMDILKAVPGSVLWLLSKDASISERLKARAEALGVDPERLVFAPVMDNDHHLARYGLVDLALDTFPVGSHTTASDALWMGAPLLALAGQSFISRVSGSIVKAAGQEHLVAYSMDEYKAKAVALGNDPGTTAALRETLLRTRDGLPLFDPERFAAHLGSAYETMVDIWRRGEKPRSFDVAAVTGAAPAQVLAG